MRMEKHNLLDGVYVKFKSNQIKSYFIKNTNYKLLRAL